MKFDVKDVYYKIYGQFKSNEDMAEFLVEKDMTYLYISRNYKDCATLLETLNSRKIDSEYEAYASMLAEMKDYNMDLTTGDWNKDDISRGRRLFMSVCSKLVHVREVKPYDIVFDTYPTIDKVYILYNSDETISCIYVDDDVEISKDLTNVSRFPDGYKELLADKLVEVGREI